MGTDDSSSGGGGGSGNSFAAQHAAAPRQALNVAPTDGSTKFNTVRIPLIPVACWRLNDPGFAFDSSFVAPAFHNEITTLQAIVSAHPECPASLFGHCDPAGSDALNKTLGDRRAIAIYAVLTRQPDLWAYLYDNPEVGDRWDMHMVQSMLASVPDATDTPYYAGIVDGQNGPQTTDAVKRFQGDSGLSADGSAGPDTRKALYGAYIDWLCTPAGDPTATPPATPFRMQPGDFLGGTGAQPGDLPKMSLQSCGKFNPVVLLPTSEMNQSDTNSRNEDDAPNRRVILFLFPKGTTLADGQWPCPKVKESNAACNSNFWPDGDTRRTNGDTRREYRTTRDTMACRFYDRFARRSPCEWGYPDAHRVALEVDDVTIAMPIPNAPLFVSISTAPRVSVPIDDQGQGNIYASTTSTAVFGLDDVQDIAIAPPEGTS
jgi:outer membrane protein OmpA-like peptidoglycan-associated protein